MNIDMNIDINMNMKNMNILFKILSGNMLYLFTYLFIYFSLARWTGAV